MENKNEENKSKKLSFSGKSIAVLFGLVLISAAAVSVFLLSYPQGESGKNSISNLLGANIAYVEGTVEYKEKNGEWKRALEGIDLFEGYSVEVLGEGKAIINLDDGSALRLNSNSSTTLESMHPKQIIILNNKGEIYSRAVKSNREFKVKSNDVIYESLGTAYKTINSDEKKGVEVYQSKVKVAEKKEGEENKETVVEEGKKYYLLNKKEPKSVNVVKEITKEEIKKDKFVMWNKEKDETEESFKEEMGALSDLTPPKLSISSPADGFETEDKTAAVKGETEKGAKVLINGKEIKNIEGKFSLEVSLKEGANKITVKSVDKAGNKAVKSITVTRKIVVVKPIPPPAPKPKPVPIPKPSYSFSLSGKAVNNGVELSWSVSGIDVSKGFKIARSESKNPVYPGNDYKYISKSEKRSYTWKISDGKTYHFRICQYLGGKCGKYSNDIKITAPKIASKVKSITLSIKGEGKVKWTVDGHSASGFKLSWSKNSGPTYPTRGEGDKFNYFSDPYASSASIDAFDGAGKYYVRVCQYIGGKCGVYSNQIEIDL